MSYNSEVFKLIYNPYFRIGMRVYIETYGCALNKADSALMKSLIVKAGHQVVSNVDDADVIVINTCTVRKDSEERVVRRIKKLVRRLNSRKLILAGCMVSAQPYMLKEIAPQASMISPQNIDKIVEAIETPTTLRLISGVRDTSYLGISVEGPIATIPIAEGCLGDCSYCVVKIARRRLMSYKPGLIVSVVDKAVKEGAKEIELTAQDTASYGIDLGNIRLSDLITRIVREVEGDYMIRVGMANPDTLQPILDVFIEVLKHPKVFKYVHIPMQSADDNVLKLMKRRYTYDQFKDIVTELRRKIPELMIATDIIVGHPGEDEEAFEKTLKAVSELMFDKVHIAQYTIRPRTEAASLPQVLEPIKKSRSKRLNEVVERVGYAINAEYIGSRAKVLLTHKSFRGDVIARTTNYKPVVIKENSKDLGSWGYALIEKVTFYDLRGRIID
jgi:MiaB-like tRNA modifying enzyme